jgi:hypothetical protein
LSNGAQPTETILAMFKEQGVWAEYLKTKKTNKKHVRKLSDKRIKAKKAIRTEKKALNAKKQSTVSTEKPVETAKVEEIKNS